MEKLNIKNCQKLRKMVIVAKNRTQWRLNKQRWVNKIINAVKPVER